MKTTTLTLFSILISGLACTKQKPARMARMNGINDEAVYVFNAADTIATVFKEKYYGQDYQIALNKDTVYLGNSFVSHINVPKENFKIVISEPSEEVIHSDNIPGAKEYTFMPTSEGIFNFLGTIQYDSLVVPFEYRFIVIEKNKGSDRPSFVK